MEIFSVPSGLIVIFGLRLFAPLIIFRWPFWGAVAAMAVDAADTNIVKPFGVEITNYTLTDKYLDTYYFTIELVVSLSWVNKLARNTSIFLYAWRLLGLAAFQITGVEYILFFAPNLFENFFLVFTLAQLLKKETAEKMWLTTSRKLAVILFVLWLPKIPQELILHVWKIGSPVETFFGWLKNWAN